MYCIYSIIYICIFAQIFDEDSQFHTALGSLWKLGSVSSPELRRSFISPFRTQGGNHLSMVTKTINRTLAWKELIIDGDVP